MNRDPQPPDALPPGPDTDSWWTLPNAISLARWIGACFLFVVALAGSSAGFAWLFLALTSSDWIDGKIAVRWRVRSRIGPWLDTGADATMYAGLVFGVAWLKQSAWLAEWPWIAAVLGTYALSVIAGLVKFGRWPSYHTRAAKVGWGLVLLAFLGLFLADWRWPLRLAAAAGIWTNLEATAITLTRRQWAANVSSLWRSWRDRES